MSTPAELAIRLARAAFNAALAKGDLAAIGPLLAPDVVLVAGTDSALITGRRAQLAAWKREFAARPRTLYTRLPERIIVSPALPIALEHGQWQGVREGAGAPEAHGDYTAKWRQSGSAWLLEAEIFLTLG